MSTPKKTASRKPTSPRATASRTASPRARKTSAPESPAPMPTGLVEVTHDAIARRAYEIAQSAGFPTGRETEFWLEAERQLREGLLV